jgi:CheY-like chemotaxis protein
MMNKNMGRKELIIEPADSQTYPMGTDEFLSSWKNRISSKSELRANPPSSGGITVNWDAPKDRYHPPGQQPAVKSLPKGNERILVVDDDQAIVKLEEDFLSILGYHVVSKTDSVKALNLFQENPERFDLVITDMNMPSMDGDRLAQKLLELRSDIPIIMCTGSFTVIDKKKIKSMGLRECIIKPIGLKTLAETIRRVLDSD